MSFHHLSFANRQAQALRAQELAESALAQAIDRVLEDPAYGTRPDLDQAVKLQWNEATGWVGFLPQLADGAQPGSTNNLLGSNSVPGWQGRRVPANSVLLVGVGQCQSVERRVETLLTVPPYPYSVSSQGRFTSSEGLLVASVSDPLSTVLGPGHLLSNSAAEAAVTIGEQARITGNLQTCGTARLSAQTVVEGELRQHAGPAQIPQLNPADLDPRTLGKSYQDTPAALFSPVLSGFLRHSGNLSVSGGVEMQGAVLYVEGDLDLEGGVRGQGALIVQGNARLQGGSALTSDGQAALVAGGSVSLQGDERSRSFFQGLVYAQGNLTARQITLMGPLVSQAEVTLQDSSLLTCPSYSALTVSPGWTDLYFEPSNGQFVASHQGDKVVLRVQRRPDGFALLDPRTGQSWTGLSSDQAMEQLSSLAASDSSRAAVRQPRENGPLWAALESLSVNPAPAAPASALAIDLNRFLPLQQKLRIRYWRNL